MFKKIPKKHYWISLLCFLIPAGFCLSIYLKFKADLPKRLSDQIQLTGSLAAQDFKRTVRDNVQAIHNLAERIEETDGEFYSYWKQDAQRLLIQNESLTFVELISEEGIIKDIYPRIKNGPAIGLDITKLDYRYSDWKTKSELGLTNITNWLQLSQGGNSFLIDVPIYFEDTFDGTVTGGMNFNSEFDRLSYYLEDFAIKIEDETGTPFYNYNNFDSAQTDSEYIFDTALVMDSDIQESWHFQLTFANPNIFRDSLKVANLALGVGLLLSFCIGLLQFFNSNLRIATHEALETNKKLQLVNTELEQQTEKAKLASTAKSEFLSNMSHEIRTPLNAIVGITDLMGSGNDDFKEEDYLELLKKSSKTLLDLINDILRLDKIESGFVEIAQIEFSPACVLESLVSFHNQIIERKGLDLSLSVNSLKNKTVLGDRAKFEQIITNILSNAIKFTTSGSIFVMYEEKEVNEQIHLKISIRDTGIGIPKEKINQIFDRFIQLDTGTRKKHSGGGLGLFIAQYLAQLLNGNIEVTSEEGKGSEFIINLKFDCLQVPTKQKEEILNKDLPELSILAVDDNKLNVVILSQLLKKIGLHADIAYNGSEAVEKAQAKNYDLIFMDIHMPDIDGFEATRLIKRTNKNTIVMGLSADTTLNSINEGISSGMSNYLTKPIDKNKLIAVIEDYFGSTSRNVV
ncbi:response regulator [Leeuwenhoekiella marinoflava]|uniref:histidine kinase n=2 Tax=Leeuwenhoekiella marinoflava TaxID=988 RepID=A0A4Q0PBX1_9FLAO|nr:response regulator [Leeuwenhoekiella marinoflava]RXG24111.1 signal transduction histidine kinase [Leeuwenhoekiella marinoflava]SHF98008.1 Signal transduction histidine kinase [Leeuwenhoekiella marinoflava DSM 3653]